MKRIQTILFSWMRLFIFSLIFVDHLSLADNWLFLQGTEPDGQGAKPRVWGFIQPQYQYTDGTGLRGGDWDGQKAVFNQVGVERESHSDWYLFRARLGLRGKLISETSKINYFLLTEFGDNGITHYADEFVVLTDASLTFNHIPFARLRIGQFKYPGAEEGLRAIHMFDYVNFSNVTDQLLLERFFDSDGSITNDPNTPNGSVGAFRDIGIQVFDRLKFDAFENSYAVMIGNGNGINRRDNDNNKDLYLYYSTEYKFKESKPPAQKTVKLFSWFQTGKRKLIKGNTGEFHRERYGIGSTVRYQKFRTAFEYVWADGMIFNGTDGGAVPGAIANNGAQVASFNLLPDEKAAGWYVDCGYLVWPRLEFDVRFDIVNRGTESNRNERLFETLTLGAQYFFYQKNRVIINYEFRDAEAPHLPSSHPANKILNGIDDRISLQLLLLF